MTGAAQTTGLAGRGYEIIAGAAPQQLVSASQSDGSPVESPPLRGPVAQALLVAEPLQSTLLGLLGKAFVLGRLRRAGDNATAVYTELPIRSRLFEDPRANALVPTFGVAAHFAPEACALSVAATHVSVPAGSVLIHDVRTPVTAVAGQAAPMLLATYYRHWFREPRDPANNPPLRITVPDYLALPPAARTAVAWRFERYPEARLRLMAYRAVSRGQRMLGLTRGPVFDNHRVS